MFWMAGTSAQSGIGKLLSLGQSHGTPVSHSSPHREAHLRFPLPRLRLGNTGKGPKRAWVPLNFSHVLYIKKLLKDNPLSRELKVRLPTGVCLWFHYPSERGPSG